MQKAVTVFQELRRLNPPDKTLRRCRFLKSGSCAWQHCKPPHSLTGNSINASGTADDESVKPTHSCRSRQNSCRITGTALHLCVQVFPAIPVVPFPWPAHAVHSSSTIQPLTETYRKTKRNREAERKGKPWLGSPSLSRISGWASVRSLPVSCEVVPGQHQRLDFSLTAFQRNLQHPIHLTWNICYV